MISEIKSDFEYWQKMSGINGEIILRYHYHISLFVKIDTCKVSAIETPSLL